MVQREQRFGGKWTDDKLDALGRYLKAYTTALKNQPFTLMYVDAFAGTGYRESKAKGVEALRLFELPVMDELAKGSARIALETNPPFDEYVFIESNRKRLQALKESVEHDFPERRDRIRFVPDDANGAVVELCQSMNWRTRRAVMFLDPFGMQVDWTTIEAIARTKGIDLFYLFPTGMGINRLMTRDGRIPKAWRARLDRIIGDRGWLEEFYEEYTHSTFFEGVVTSQKKVYDDVRAEKFILGRLKRIFAGVAEHALPLRNSKGQCMYLLTFACGNRPGAQVALPIVQHLFQH